MEGLGLRPAQAKCYQDPSQPIKKNKKVGVVAQT
jgi:hypothetical protein